jgi:hypothetical protein
MTLTPAAAVAPPDVDAELAPDIRADAARLDDWAAFPVTRRPRPLVLLGPMLREPEYLSDEAKAAVAAGRLELVAPSPRVPGRLAVRIPGGTFELPTIGARSAFAAGCAIARGDGPPLRITKVTLGAARFTTDRGRLMLPAWLFWAPGMLTPLAMPALHPSVFWRPGELDWPVDGPDSELVAAGRLLTMAVPAPSPLPGADDLYQRHVPEVAESRTAVTIGLRTEITAGDPAPVDHDHLYDLAGTVTHTVRLATPLGNRVTIGADGRVRPALMV